VLAVALPLMSCTHMAQYLQLRLLHRTKVDLAARADPRRARSPWCSAICVMT